MSLSQYSIKVNLLSNTVFPDIYYILIPNLIQNDPKGFYNILYDNSFCGCINKREPAHIGN